MKFCKKIAEIFFYVQSDTPTLNSYRPPCPEVIEYLVSRLQKNRKWKFHSPNNLRTAMESNQELYEFFKFILEYIMANFPDKGFENRYRFLFNLYRNRGIASDCNWIRNKSAYITGILRDITQLEKFKYGIHSYLLSDD